MAADYQREAMRFIQARDWPNALAQIDLALRAGAGSPRLLLNKAQCLLALGRRTEAVDSATVALSNATRDAVLLDAIGSFFSFAGDQHTALNAFERAVALAPGNAHFLFNRATVLRFHGHLDAAESDYDRVIALRPTDFEAYKNRSDLRRQTPDKNHVAQLEALLARGFTEWRAEVQIRYALAKEYEDLGEYEKSFGHLALGASKRRANMNYDVANDVRTVDWIIEAFPSGPPPGAAERAREPPSFSAASLESAVSAVGFAAVQDRLASGQDSVALESATPSTVTLQSAPSVPGAAQAVAPRPITPQPAAPMPAAPMPAAPIFIVGLPRSGTTLVDRILSSHSQVTSAGELNAFALTLVAAVRRANPGAQLPRRELVARSADIDFAAVGRDYLEAAHAVAGPGCFTDKMPLNYLYCGLIRRALPNAKIVHLTRHPMAAGYAMFKTLFKDGYPFSYDLTEIGRYFGAYRRLMDHWNSTMPSAIYTLQYEDLVADQVGESRRLLQYCGLEWEDACADFHRNSAATTTQSAAQVRQPIYRTSVAQWRHYDSQLAILSEVLKSAGINL
jgi:Tfp pilus assembly protein PilF